MEIGVPSNGDWRTIKPNAAFSFLASAHKRRFHLSQSPLFQLHLAQFELENYSHFYASVSSVFPFPSPVILEFSFKLDFKTDRAGVSWRVRT